MNYKRLRRDLIEYYGTAMAGGFPMAMMDLSKVENMSAQELVEEARKLKFDLNKYKL